MEARHGRRSAIGGMCLLAALALLLTAAPALAQTTTAGDPTWASDPPDLSELVAFAETESALRVAVDRFVEDRAAIGRRYPVEYSPVRRDRYRTFYRGWQQRLAQLDFDGLGHEAQIDYVLLRNRLAFELEMLDLDERRWTEIAPLVPFADRLRALQEDRFDRVRVDPRTAAGTLDDVASEIEALTAGLPARAGGSVSPTVANRAAAYVAHLRETVADWNRFYDGYDPLFGWWSRVPHTRLDAALGAYRDGLLTHLVGIRPDDPGPIVGDPVLAEGLQAHLTVEMIPYTAEELIAIGWREFEWTEARFREVSQRMGFGDDWQAALEHVKTLAPPPGEKPWVIFDIAQYSEAFVDSMDAVTVAPLAAEIWRLQMQTEAQQLINPFFSGGEVTRVSYPTDRMSHDDKLMSMRGNTPSFNFATVHHELIPGHHYQGFMTDRFNAHRAAIARTPFWGEGWALYWELILWDADFPRSDADRIGMLFWRLHRAARIVFSLNFQLGEWTPQQAVDFLVERVGHERANAEAEVRRSAQVEPLYQIAYLIGGLQFRALNRELVESGRMSLREYHDTVLQGGRMPVEMVRARLIDQPLTRDFRTQWRFYGDPIPTGSR